MAARARIIGGVATTLIVIGACGSGATDPSTEPEPEPAVAVVQQLTGGTTDVERPLDVGDGETRRYR